MKNRLRLARELYSKIYKSIFEKKLLDAQNLNSRFLNYTFFRILSDPIEPEMTVKKKIPTFHDKCTHIS